MSRLVEEWRPVVGYERLYEVSDWGNVKSLDRIIRQLSKWGSYFNCPYKGRMLKKCRDKDGYRIVTLSDKEHKQKVAFVHRLVAEAFIPNPENKPQIDHIIPVSNGGTDEVWNLRWATPPENSNNQLSVINRGKWERPKGENHCWYCKKRPEHAKLLSIPIVQIMENGEIKEWESAKICAETLKASASHITNAVNGKNRKLGHKFKDCLWYKKDDYQKMLSEQIA